MRIPELAYEAVDAPLREELDQLPPLRLTRALAHAQDVLLPHLRLGAALLTATELGEGHRELAILRVAALTGAGYAWTQHVELAARAGVSVAQIGAIERDDVDAGDFDEREHLVLQLTTELLRRDTADATTMASLRSQFSDREVVELLLVVGRWRMLAMVINALDIEPEIEMADAVLGWARRAVAR